jgi:hypothetical protein
MKRIQNPPWLLAFLLLFLGCASNPSEVRSHRVVQINNMKLAPEVAEVSGADNSVVWTNWSNNVASVHFPASMKSAFTCDELRPQFVLSGDRIESVEVLGGNESLATPCPLKPGSYSYEVWLSGSRMQRENPHLKIQGKIEVGE